MEEHLNFSMEDLMILCYKYSTELNILSKLKAIRVSTNKIETDKFPGDYYLLNINLIKMSVNVQIFNKSQFNDASEQYLRLEKSISESENAVVLVSASSLKLLKKAYPSYFLDTSEFISAIEKMNQNCEQKNYI